MKILKTTLLLVTTILLFSCLKEEKPPEPIVEYGGYSVFYVENKSMHDLAVTYEIVIPTHLKADSTVTVPKDSTTEIFKLGGIGGYFFPSEVFSNLVFRADSDTINNPLLIIDSIVDEDWIDITQEKDTVAKFNLIIMKDDL